MAHCCNDDLQHGSIPTVHASADQPAMTPEVASKRTPPSLLKPTTFSIAHTVALLGCPVAAYANAGVPMIMVSYPGMLVALLPITWIETATFERRLRLGARHTGWRVGAANAVSTIVGYPLLWLCWVALQLLVGLVFVGLGKLPWFHNMPEVSLDAMWGNLLQVIVAWAWYAPITAQGGNWFWMMPAAALIGLIPAFFVSVWIEGQVLKRLFKTTDAATTWQLTWRANQVTYGLLAALVGAWLLSTFVSR